MDDGPSPHDNLARMETTGERPDALSPAICPEASFPLEASGYMQNRWQADLIYEHCSCETITLFYVIKNAPTTMFVDNVPCTINNNMIVIAKWISEHFLFPKWTNYLQHVNGSVDLIETFLNRRNFTKPTLSEHTIQSAITYFRDTYLKLSCI